eukprot:CAMPEP_0204299952 /NCGR_PEP_ID=MMETSP0468-20130131/77708_1 /ASSEMBLY_ACC=CAM_ASM_000383 /TAXON_ID=2969 /ORGANISM="Oxyrrhis marina" /LENGTH=71 /DNA_ID=CAMNT_0051278969 /DNA_START=11 /DNA_END=226 /DNA_ORIENTATION=-
MAWVAVGGPGPLGAGAPTVRTTQRVRGREDNPAAMSQGRPHANPEGSTTIHKPVRSPASLQDLALTLWLSN